MRWLDGPRNATADTAAATAASITRALTPPPYGRPTLPRLGSTELDEKEGQDASLFAPELVAAAGAAMAGAHLGS